jgi:hypothetical protein
MRTIKVKVCDRCGRIYFQYTGVICSSVTDFATSEKCNGTVRSRVYVDVRDIVSDVREHDGKLTIGRDTIGQLEAASFSLG